MFTLSNGIFQLLYGQLADTVNYRKWILLVCSLAFCGSVFLMSFVQGFWGFFFSRLLYSIFMASNVPISVSLLCDYTVPWERGIAQSLYAAGMYLGVGFSSLSILLDEALGWRGTMQLISIICGGLSLLFLILPEPKRNVTNALLADALVEGQLPSDASEAEMPLKEKDQDLD